MAELKPPPMPPKPVLVAIALILLGMIGIIVLLLAETIKKDLPADSAQTTSTDAGANSNTNNPLDQSTQKKAENIAENVANDHYRDQLIDRTENSVNETTYLQDRNKGFWYILFPLIVIIILFIIWVYKNHKDWIN